MNTIVFRSRRCFASPTAHGASWVIAGPERAILVAEGPEIIGLVVLIVRSVAACRHD
jgi:hypothetical protein